MHCMLQKVLEKTELRLGDWIEVIVLVRVKSDSRKKIDQAWAAEYRKMQGFDEGSVDNEEVKLGIDLFGEFLTGRCECGSSRFYNRVIDSELIRTCKECKNMKRVG